MPTFRRLPRETESGSAAMPWRQRIERLLDEPYHAGPSAFGNSGSSWPTAEVSENGKEVRISAEVSGIGSDDRRLQVGDGVLSIRGERDTRDEAGGHSRFERRIRRLCGVDGEGARAGVGDRACRVNLLRSDQAERGRWTLVRTVSVRRRPSSAPPPEGGSCGQGGCEP